VLYKALTAAALCRALEKKGLGVFVPVFWSASEDHDAREFSAAHVPARDGSLRKISLRIPRRDAGKPASEVSAPGFLDEPREAFMTLARESGGDPALEAILRSLPADGPAPFFGALLHRLLPAWGLVVVEPRLLREEGRGVLERELADPEGSAQALGEGGERLRALGFEVPLEASEPGLLFLECEDGIRRRVRRGAGSWSVEGRGTVSAAELLASPQVLSTNVALRPILEDAVLPTVAYATGPAEAGYLAQLGPLYDFFGVGRPVIFPRISATLLSVREAEALTADGAPPEEVFSGKKAGGPGSSPESKRLARMRRAALPRGRLQERVTAWPWFGFRHGAGVFDALLDSADPFDFRHKIHVVG
jgi:uncharacterized protein YllA (UPF0747 family)